MRVHIISLAFLLAVGLMVLPATVPALEDLSVTQDASAAACLIGYDQDCILTIYPCMGPGPCYPP